MTIGTYFFVFGRRTTKATAEIGIEVSAAGVADQRSDRFDVLSGGEKLGGALQSHFTEILAEGAAGAFSEEAPQMARREIHFLGQEKQRQVGMRAVFGDKTLDLRDCRAKIAVCRRT